MRAKLLLSSTLFAVIAVVSSVALSAPAPWGAWCPAGYHPAASENEARLATTDLSRIAREVSARADTERLAGRCVADKHPESYNELAAARGQMNAMLNAPAASMPDGADLAAQRHAAMLAAAATSVPGANGTWAPYGKGPLIANDPRFTSVNGYGLTQQSGRVDSLDYDPVSKRLFAVLGTGGVWMSENLGKSWRSIGDTLPTQIFGAGAWTSAGGGRFVVVAGEPIMAGSARIGDGAFYTDDLGKTWHHATGVPNGILGFQVAVDFTKPNVVYVATSKGLFRSDNAGSTFSNVKLPTGACAGKTDNGRCIFGTMVTDVVVQKPDKFGHAGGKVLAVVGYRSSVRPFPQDPDVIESEWNGLYGSDTGKPGTFAKLAATGFAPQNRIGKVELGAAEGPEQNHNYVYALVQDAILLRGGYPSIDAPEDAWPGAFNTVLNGLYVSPDFGQTWQQVADTATIAENPATGSALVGVGQAILYAPGVQAWYNQWIKPDPTRQSTDGIPTRLLFGLEEIWQNDLTNEPVDGPATFHVIGRYYAGDSCLFLDTGVPACPTARQLSAATTTHPDQHEGLFVPDGSGGVTIFAGNDGGVYDQHVASGEEFDNTKWGDGLHGGFYTLLPYHAQMAKDGTVWFGLQDNGSGKIEPGSRKIFETVGGDGHFVGVDPDNSNYAWTETPGGSMRVTTDGGVTWTGAAPPISGAQLSPPLVMDPLDADHLITAGREVVETVDGPATCVSVSTPVADQTLDCTWTEVFNLGTQSKPGDNSAEAAGDDPANSMSAIEMRGDSAYVGFCGPCDIINTGPGVTFKNGIATNVGAAAAPERMTSNGWHVADAKGLPNRYINWIAMDPANPKTIYVALGGYAAREWRGPGTYADKNDRLGRGNVFVSNDAGDTFRDISGNLPNTPALTLVKRGSQLVVGTKIGAFISSDLAGSEWSVLGSGLPPVMVSSLQIAPQDPNLLVAATFGRGIYVYQFPKTGVLGSRRQAPAKRPLPATGIADWHLGAVLLAVAAALVNRRRYTLRGKS